jgi:hypothetical protein
VSRKGQINKKINEQKFFLIVYTDFVWNISYSKKNLTRYYHKCI